MGKMSGMLRKHRFSFLGSEREGNPENLSKQTVEPTPLQCWITDWSFNYLTIQTIIFFQEDKYTSRTNNYTLHCPRLDFSGTRTVQRGKTSDDDQPQCGCLSWLVLGLTVIIKTNGEEGDWWKSLNRKIAWHWKRYVQLHSNANQPAHLHNCCSDPHH